MSLENYGQQNLTWRDDFTVSLMQNAGSDEMVIMAAKVSTHASKSADLSDFTLEGSQKFIDFLMKNRHGSPFEHGLMTFQIEAPIFVWREFMRHRIGHSYNEQSGRYMEMLPVFYMPPTHRPLVQVGKPGAYQFVPGTEEQYSLLEEAFEQSVSLAWASYQDMLAGGIAKEVARQILPLNIYSSAYVTVNPRSLMSFLSLRTKDEMSVFPSYPQWEIEQVALGQQEVFADLYPITFESFDKFGRVAP